MVSTARRLSLQQLPRNASMRGVLREGKGSGADTGLGLPLLVHVHTYSIGSNA